MALFANDLALLERRGAGAVDDGAKPRILHHEQGVVSSGIRGETEGAANVGYVRKRAAGVMNVASAGQEAFCRILKEWWVAGRTLTWRTPRRKGLDIGRLRPTRLKGGGALFRLWGHLRGEGEG